MAERYVGQLTGGTHDQRVVALAGALAEGGVTAIHAEITGAPTAELTARSTDLPGFLSDPNRIPVLRGHALTEITVNPESIVWTTRDAAIRDALGRAQTSLH